jgi:hemerythrin-like metal-binding protein
MSIARKLIIMVLVGQVALIFVTLFSWQTTYSIDQGYREMLKNDYRQVELAMESLDRLGKSVQAYKNSLVRNDPKYVDEFNRECSLIEANLKECTKFTDENERKLLDHALQTHAAYRNSIFELVKARESNDDIAYVDKNVAQGIDKPMRADLESLAETSRVNIGTQIRELQHRAKTKLYVQVGSATGAGTFMLIFGFMLVRNIRGRIDNFAATIGRVAENDLTVQFDEGSQDEVGRLGSSFQYMTNNLRELIGTLAETSSEVSKYSVEMQSDAQMMASGAEEAAAQSTTVATAGEEMSATAGDIAQNCHLAAESARRANDAADKGAIVVENSIVVMHRIAERVQSSAKTVEELGKRSDQIGSIINTIEDIADQTNLLALNAAIEAARAGDQGRGFAVVADEVRALAERTAKATQEIGKMIKSIQQETRTAVTAMEEGVAEVEQGTQEAARSGEALRMIQDEINSVNLQVQQIATAAEEQTAVTSEISGNIHQITDVVQGTAEGARKTLTAAEYLSGLSNELKRMVSQFKVSESGKLIEWTNSYSVAVGPMDQEHQKLVGIINNLYGAMHSGRGQEVIGTILDELITYTRTHFSHEERLMQESGYPGLDEQKRAHEALISQVMETQSKYRSGTALSQEVMSFLKDWLVNHIQGMDKRYGPHLNKNGIK